jgi:hypothetical protein
LGSVETAVRRVVVSTVIVLVSLLAAWCLVQLQVAAPVAFILFLGLNVAFIPVARLVPPIGALLLAFPVFVGAALAASYATNSFRLASFASQLREYPPPSEASIVAASERIGVFLGMGNHCDFLAEIELRSSLTTEEVRGHYAPLRLRPAVPGPQNPEPSLEVVPAGAGLHTIRATAGPYDRNLDVRCT